MGYPRSKYVKEGEEGAYHCICRCVRRAFLCGRDPVTGRDFSHRKQLILDRLRYLAAIFAIDVCAYAILENHFHNILRTRPDIVATWSDHDVATRWLTLFPKKSKLRGPGAPPLEEDILALTCNTQRIAKLRKRLSSLSWFMGRLNEHIARVANKEDEVKGRFWESRFKCQALLDEAAIVACMSYVDLNLVRAGMAATPEESDFTSIQERIRAWKEENMKPETALQEESLEVSSDIPELWLCPIETDSKRRGILSMTTAEYIDLVDRSGRLTRSDKRGAIDPSLAPVLSRIGVNPETWSETVTQFESRFHVAAGLVSSLRDFATKSSVRWIKGLATAKAAFAPAQSK